MDAPSYDEAGINLEPSGIRKQITDKGGQELQ